MLKNSSIHFEVKFICCGWSYMIFFEFSSCLINGVGVKYLIWDGDVALSSRDSMDFCISCIFWHVY